MEPKPILFNILLVVMHLSCIITLDIDSIPIEKKALHVPSLQELADIFSSSLVHNFAEVNVEVVDSPDLSQRPFLLANKGLNGNPKLIEFGDPSYLAPLPQKDKIYDLREIAKLSELDPAFFIGAAAGPFPFVGVNCEEIINLSITNGTVNQQSRIAKVYGVDEHVAVEELPNTETRAVIIGNVFVSEGKAGKVIKVHARNRTGSLNFADALRSAIENNYSNDQLVGIGGAFVITEGKVYQHVMRDFSEVPLVTDEDVNNWLKFYEMSAPLTAVGTFLSNTGGDLDLHVQHFHSFGTNGEAGHYHNDTTPETAEYLGYFNVANEVYRIDKPSVTHKFGRN